MSEKHELVSTVSYRNSVKDEGFFIGQVEVHAVNEAGEQVLPCTIIQACTARTPAMAVGLALKAAGQYLATSEQWRRRCDGIPGEDDEDPVDRKP